MNQRASNIFFLKIFGLTGYSSGSFRFERLGKKEGVVWQYDSNFSLWSFKSLDSSLLITLG